jgi:hypothetical protein
MAMIGASLEKLIGKKLIRPGIQSDVGSTIAEQAYYLVTVAEEVTMRGENSSAIAMDLLANINNSFNTYLDAKAGSAAGHKKFHSVYEFDMSGNPNARLFYHQRWGAQQYAKSSIFLKQATKPNRNGYAFPNKAYVMQLGEPVYIEARNVNMLAFYGKKVNHMVFKESVTVEHPGGPESQGSLNAAYMGFWNTGIPKKIMEDRKLLNNILKSTRKKTTGKSASAVKAQARSEAARATKLHTRTKDA